jgi:hypothetical protein
MLPLVKLPKSCIVISCGGFRQALFSVLKLSIENYFEPSCQIAESCMSCVMFRVSIARFWKPATMNDLAISTLMTPGGFLPMIFGFLERAIGFTASLVHVFTMDRGIMGNCQLYGAQRTKQRLRGQSRFWDVAAKRHY